jgi:ankyrin repeat protein
VVIYFYDDFITVKALIEAGVDVNARNKSGESALHIAAVRGYQEITALLIAEGADVNAREEAVKLLIAKGADAKAKNKESLTPLQIASQKGYQSIVTLLEKHGR